MPKALEKKLKSEAKSKGLSKERSDAYVYGTMRKTGWVPNHGSKNNSKKLNGGCCDNGKMDMGKKC